VQQDGLLESDGAGAVVGANLNWDLNFGPSGGGESIFGDSEPASIILPPRDIGDKGGEAVSDIDTEPTNTPPSTPKRPLQTCALINHRWEECDKASYVLLGCLRNGKKCYICDLEFRSGQVVEGQAGYWLSGSHRAYHCLECRNAYCEPCYNTLYANSPGRGENVGRAKRSRK
jgi:hypothetical protein